MKVRKRRVVRKKTIWVMGLSLVLLIVLGLAFKLNHSYPKELLTVDTKTKEVGEMKTIKEKNKSFYKVFHLPKLKNKAADEWIRKISEENEKYILDHTKDGQNKMQYKQDYESYDVEGIQSIAIHLYENGKKVKTDVNTFGQDDKAFNLEKLFNREANRYLTHLIREKNPMPEKADRVEYLSNNHIAHFNDFVVKKDGIQFFFETEDYFLDFKSHKHFLNEDFAGFSAEKGEVPSVYLDRGVKKNQKLVAFTFDDGPHFENTQKLMDVLEEYNGQGTFFMVGERVAGQEEIVKDVIDRGHQVANHSFSHQNFNAIPQSEVEKEINLANEAFKKATGYAGPYMIRPPYGNANKTVRENNPHVFVNWSVDTLDWKTRNPEAICKAIETYSYDGAIILLHDLYQTSYEGFKCGIKKLHDQGYEFVTVEELLKAKEVDIKTNSLYFDAL